MKTNKSLSVALAAVIVASGCGVASAVPAFAADSTSTTTTTSTPPSAPYPPTNLKANGGSWESWSNTWNVNFSWTAPTVLSGTVDYYIVDAITSGQSVRSYNTKTPQMNVSGLTPNATYSVNVRAVVLGSDGTRVVTPAATLSYKTPAPAVISAPTNLRVLGWDSSVVALGWTAPANTQVPYYTIDVSPSLGQFAGKQYRSYSPNFSIPRYDLISGYNYTVTVKAYGVTNTGSVAPSSGTTTTFYAP